MSYLDAIPEASPMGAAGVKMALYEQWLTRWMRRIGPRAYRDTWWMGKCSVCGARAGTFSIGEWFCRDHLKKIARTPL